MKRILLYPLLALIIFACNKEKKECPGAIAKTFDFTGFTKVNLGHANTVAITKGSAYSVKATGCADDLADLAMKIEPGKILDITFRNSKNNRNRIDFVITMPQFVGVTLSGAAKAAINGFEGQPTVMRTILSGASECVVSGAGINVAVDLSGASTLTVNGATESLYGNISGASLLEAYGLPAAEVDISVSGNSKAQVTPIDKIFAESSGNSRVYYKGNPPVKNFVTSGNGKIIQE